MAVVAAVARQRRAGSGAAAYHWRPEYRGLHRRRGQPAGGRAGFSDHSSGSQRLLGRAADHRPSGAIRAGGGRCGPADAADGGYLSRPRRTDSRAAMSAIRSVWMPMSDWICGRVRRCRQLERDSIELRSMVRPDGRDVDPVAWSPRVVTLLHMAAGLPEVDRILVNPAIKQQLCREVTGDRSWLHLIRPWYGHAAHMHIRFRCPAGQADCVQAPPPPPGDGCDATLQWWFDQLNAPPRVAEAVSSAARCRLHAKRCSGSADRGSIVYAGFRRNAFSGSSA